jgi:hypothetical protein
MKIDNEVGAQNLAMINKKNNTQEVMFDSKESVTVTEQSINKVPQEISLSTEGKLTQAIDKTSDEIDDILIKHITPDQKKELTSIYSRLDDLFAKEKLTDKEVKSTEALFEQVHVIFESGIEKLTKTERNEVEKLSSKMDKLTSTLEKNERINVEVAHSSPAIGNTSDSLSGAEIKSHKKTLTVAELNALSAIELNKLSTTQLNTLPIAQLKHLSPNSVDKLNQSQENKLATA